MIDTVALTCVTKRLAACMDAHRRPNGFLQSTYDAPPFGTAYVCISPSEQSTDPAANHNRIELWGAEGGLTADGLASLLALFDQADVAQFFVWLGPGPDMDAVRQWLRAAGMCRVARQPLMLRHDAAARPPAVPSLDVRILAVETCAEAAILIDLAAHDDGRAIGTAALCARAGVAYLGATSSTEIDDRHRVQQALLAKQIETATTLGCHTIVAEAPASLEGTSDHLCDDGFALAYVREIYGRRASSSRATATRGRSAAPAAA